MKSLYESVIDIDKSIGHINATATAAVKEKKEIEEIVSIFQKNVEKKFNVKFSNDWKKYEVDENFVYINCEIKDINAYKNYIEKLNNDLMKKYPKLLPFEWDKNYNYYGLIRYRAEYYKNDFGGKINIGYLDNARYGKKRGMELYKLK